MEVNREPGVRDWQHSSLMAWGKKLLQSLSVVHLMVRYLLPKASRLNRSWCKWVGFLEILSTLVTQHLEANSWTGGREVPIILPSEVNNHLLCLVDIED